MDKIVPCLWFDHQAEEAARFYVSIFRQSKMGAITRYGEVGQNIHGRPPGTVMTVEFTIEGQDFLALNGGPAFTFNEAISLQVMCTTQAEVDEYSSKLSAGGDPDAQQCGWLKDKYGVSWQIVPTVVRDMLRDTDRKRADRVMSALLKMKKLDIAALKHAYERA